ncbi:MAG: energy transducer TonB [Proteobacteria bacterium]|nr:energy transducer TonB [Pseudomonadota bacterium]
MRRRHVAAISRVIAFGAILAGAMFRTPQVEAEDPPVPPPYRMLSCEEQCGTNYVPAQAIDETPPQFPMSEAGYTGSVYTEGLVVVRFVIGTDGHTKDVAVEKLIGPADMGEKSRRSVSGWLYKPATLEGKPVEQPGEIAFSFQVKDADKGARVTVTREYRRAQELADSGKVAEAVAAMRDLLKRPELNFYERCTISYSLAVLYAHDQDYVHAREFARNATIQDGGFLERKTRLEAIRMRIQLEAFTGEFAETMAWFDKLKKLTSVSSDDHEQQIVNKVQAALDGTAGIAVDGIVPPSDVQDSWRHTLVRRRFDFSKINGKLDHFKLRCKQYGIESPINDQAQWTVPKSWGDCQLYVFGTPDTTFQLVESRT